MYRIFKWTCFALLALLGAVVLLGAGGYGYLQSLDLDQSPAADPASRPADLAFLRDAPAERGRILAVVSSTERFPQGDRLAGFELTELARAYYVFVANGYAVDIASPRGGSPPMRKDDELIDADYAFLNDADAQAKLANTIALAAVEPSRYAAIYLVGGKGAMFDFPQNTDLQRALREIHQHGGVIGAVCHGPAGLLNVDDADGKPLLAGRRVTGFSNDEELFLIKDARERFPELLQDALSARGARYSAGPLYLDHSVVDGRLVSGQNPWSTWSVADSMIRALGHQPVPRQPTGEELSQRVLAAYHQHGFDAAAAMRAGLPIDRRQLLMHAFVAAMRGRLGEAHALQSLVRG